MKRGGVFLTRRSRHAHIMKSSVLDWCMDPNWGIAKDLIFLGYDVTNKIYVVPFHFKYHNSDPYWWDKIRTTELADVLRHKISLGRNIVIDATMEGSIMNPQIEEYEQWIIDNDISYGSVKWAFNNARLNPELDGNKVFFPHFLTATLQEFHPYVKCDYSHIHKEYDFLCLNRRMRTGKYKLLKELNKRGWLDRTLYTYVKTLGEAGGIDNSIKRKQLPDDNVKGPKIASLDNEFLYGLNTEIYHKVKVDIVNETYYGEEDQFHFTEKVFKPIMLGVPFVVNGVKRYLQRLRELGFETFDSVIDESYDRANDDVRYSRVLDAARELALIHNTKKVRMICARNKARMLDKSFHEYVLKKSFFKWFSHESFVTQTIPQEQVHIVKDTLGAKFKDFKFLAVGSHIFSDDPFFDLIKTSGWHGWCVDQNPIALKGYFHSITDIKDKVSTIQSYVLPPGNNLIRKIKVHQRHSSDITLVPALEEVHDDTIDNVWVKCMSTEEMELITGTNIDAIGIDAEGLDSDILLSLSNEIWGNLKVVLVETVSKELIRKMYECKLDKIYYVDDKKHGQYHIFTKDDLEFKFKANKYTSEEMQAVIQSQLTEKKNW